MDKPLQVAAAPAAEASRKEEGTGLVSSAFAFAFFGAFLLLAVQIIVRLYAASVVSSVATEAVNSVATSGQVSAQAESTAVSEARQHLGSWGQSVKFQWIPSSSTGDIELQVVAEAPRVMPMPASWRSITRTVQARVENFQS